MSSRRDKVWVLLASIAFATSSPLARMAHGCPTVAVAAGRTAIAASLLWAWAPRRAVAAYRSERPRGLVMMTAAGLALAAHFYFFLAGLAATSFAAAVGLLSLEPLAVVLAAWIAFGIRPGRAEWTGVCLATLGAFVVSRGAGVGEHRLAGDAMVVAAVALYGGYVALARGTSMPSTQYAAAVYGVAAAALAPFAFAALHTSAPTPATAWGAVVLLALVPTLVGHTLVQAAARTAAPALVALTSPGETVGSLAIGAALMGRWPTTIEGIGTSLIVSGAVIAILRPKANGHTMT